MYRIGIDVGGTNTDSALLDSRALSTPSRGLLASCKTPTTPDITSGIKTAVELVLEKSQVVRRDVLSVAIGTTHFVNAVVEADAGRLSRVAVIPPFLDFPSNLKSIMEGPIFYLNGGLEIDGREITPLDPAEVKATVEAIHDAGIKMIALVGVFSPLDHDGIHEERCKSIMLQQDPSLSIVCSHNIGASGLIERENATILNASILPLARKTVHGFRQAMSKLKLNCQLYLTQNDGTLTDAATAAEFPIRTFASGPTNSMRGAAFLQGLDQPGSFSDKQVLVVDIGGTTTDICALLPSGFPRQAPNFVEVGGVRTAFSMPEVLSIGLGGGSLIKVDNDAVSVGPESVGHRLTGDALVFGGEVMTATDIVVASGISTIGEPKRIEHISTAVITKARKAIKNQLEKSIEEMKVSATPVTVLLVGGGSVIVMDELEGVEESNAVGAAIGNIAGEIDIIEIMADRDEKAVFKAAEEMAIAAAITKGADADDVKIVQFDKIPLQYVTNKATRIVIKAVGKLAVSEGKPARGVEVDWEEEPQEENKEKGKHNKISKSNLTNTLGNPSLSVDIASYRPEVKNGVWYLSSVDIEFIACGTGILGTGGGGPSYNASLVALSWLSSAPGKMRVIPPSSLADTAICVFPAGYGAPSVSSERMDSGTEIFTAIDAINKVMGYKDFDALMTGEIGGGNGLATFPSSVKYDRPIVDADFMGRAYPTLAHGLPYVYGCSITPCAMADAKGNISIVMSGESNAKVEGLMRTTCVELGLSASMAGCLINGAEVKKITVPNTLSQSWHLGRAVHLARREKTDLIKAIFDTTPGRLLYSGKIISITRDVSRGYTIGRCYIAPTPDDELDSTASATRETRNLMIPFQNEYLYAAYVDPSSSGSNEGEEEEDVICTVPDLISILGQDGEALGSPELRYGLKVKVIGMPAHPLWTGTEEGLKVGGPEFFGFDMKWQSVGEYKMPRSVIEEYDTVA
ncbi:Acetophenone carboxylase 70 kDa subunit [Hyphodiscus hymeniophilus]|uniref:Acetophenone carboxylase 70 kDa subunit n=1 Tax=Hyphodiscus hymeniophilus TaxID=353542 RepID=A0A9P6VG98_9HELO|nr:Acetophenone carboxylase 70 kDa subunit [Hyphodiscus hymeniophilus]